MTTPAAVELGAVRWTDRQKLAALLQASALLSHLERAGQHLPAGWQGARGGFEGRLLAPEPARGRSTQPAQDALRDLLGILFGGALKVPGRGEARRAARALLDAWRHSLTPLPPDEAVGQILEAAPFLWEPAFAAARRSLLAEPGGPGEPAAWVAGPGWFRGLLLAQATNSDADAADTATAAVGALLASPRARELWARVDGVEIRAAVAGSGSSRLGAALVLYRRGRFRRALAFLAGLRLPTAAVLRLRCHHQLGELGAVRDGLRRLAESSLGPAELLDAAEVAVRTLAKGGDPGRAVAWVERALLAAGEGGPEAISEARLALRAHLLAAEAAWDRQEPEAHLAHLEAARPALADPDLAWRWHHSRGLAALAADAAEDLVASLHRALAGGRRRMSRHEASGLWNDLGIGRVGSGDLPGAERAFRHAARLLHGCDGPRQTTLALYNLAEVSLRRGHLAGVREILETSMAENRLAGNIRGLTQDSELWARFELVQGRPGAALTLCREARAQLPPTDAGYRQAELRTLAARALGWLGRAEEAAAELAGMPPALAELEPEEWPALWALAGRRNEALAVAGVDGGTPCAPLWRAALTAGTADPADWALLAGLEPYRAARLVFDLEAVHPGGVPAEHRRAACGVLRGVGADFLAERLEAREAGGQGPWHALAAYLGVAGAGAEPAALLRAVGQPEAALTLVTAEGSKTLLAGAGGEVELAAETAAGRLVLRVAATDIVVETVFALLARDLGAAGGLEPSPPPGSAPMPVRAGGLVGDSPLLVAALERLGLLAPRELTVLILGETGTGKELAARLVHRASPRAKGPFVAVNCAALSESLLLSDLFGHVRGAFTGAERDRQGVFETAQRGTVFLDEIGDLPPVAQGMLLRVLQESEVRRVGESLPRRVDVRVVAATHRDLSAAVAAGTFRSDLYYRLKVGSVVLPPLRERGADILLLADHFLAALRAPGFLPVLSRRARETLLAHPFPGNVRELQNVLAVAAALAGGGTIEAEHLGLPAVESARPRQSGGAGYHHQVDEYRRRVVADAMADAKGNQAEAARILGLSRQGLSYLIRQLKLL